LRGDVPGRLGNVGHRPKKKDHRTEQSVTRPTGGQETKGKQGARIVEESEKEAAVGPPARSGSWVTVGQVQSVDGIEGIA